MADQTTNQKKSMSADWLVRGVLTKVGDAFDRLTGRGWRPSSSLATSELAERLKSLVDKEMRETADGRRFVPQNIQLKMQWDKFSSDSEGALKKLENELLTSLVDHINDKRYYTYAPLSLTVKPDYFVDGVKLFASFDEKSDEDKTGVVNVTVPGLKIDAAELEQYAAPRARVIDVTVRAEVAGRAFEKSFELKPDKRLSIGRTAENDIALDDASVSKLHASLVMNKAGELLIADTGSTNGTFVDGERISYGESVTVGNGQAIRFGTVNVNLECRESEEPDDELREAADEAGQTYKVGEFEFTSKAEIDVPSPPATLPAVPIPHTQIIKPIETRDSASNEKNGHEVADGEARLEK